MNRKALLIGSLGGVHLSNNAPTKGVNGGQAVAFNRNAGGHAFDFSAGVCAKCDMTREDYQDKGQPACTGRKPEKREAFRVSDDDGE